MNIIIDSYIHTLTYMLPSFVKCGLPLMCAIFLGIAIRRTRRYICTCIPTLTLLALEVSVFFFPCVSSLISRQFSMSSYVSALYVYLHSMWLSFFRISSLSITHFSIDLPLVNLFIVIGRVLPFRILHVNLSHLTFPPPVYTSLLFIPKG